MVSVPVYSNENGLHFINIYLEDEDGTFRRTQDEPLRLLRDDIQGISPAQGEMVSQKHDRQERDWCEPTISFHYGRPQSFHHFLRQNLSKNKFYVFSKPSLSGRLSKFNIHELQLKTSVSQRKISILKEKYSNSTNLWSEAEYQRKNHVDSESNMSYLSKNNKILRANKTNGTGANTSFELSGANVSESQHLNGKNVDNTIDDGLDIEVSDFMENPFPSSQGRAHSQKRHLKDKHNSHFLLRFLFDRE